MEALAFPLRQEAILTTFTEEVVKGGEIDGKQLHRDHVRRSVARRLGMDLERGDVPDRDLEGTIDVMVDATRRSDERLTAERLGAWHALLFPAGRRDVRSMAGGDLSVFLQWFEDAGEASRGLDPVLKAGLAHLWFVTIHPFDAGNHSIARAIANLTLARSERSPRRFYSLSAQIRLEQEAYDGMLEWTGQGPLDVTPWLEWWLGCFGRAIDRAPAVLARVLAKARFRRTYQDLAVNGRQRQMISRLLDGDERVDGKLTTTTWATLANCSHDTALRDIAQLVDRGVMVRSSSGGRSTSYALRRHPSFAIN